MDLVFLKSNGMERGRGIPYQKHRTRLRELPYVRRMEHSSVNMV